MEIKSPKWADAAVAIRRMDDNEYPIVRLSWKDADSCFDDEESFNVIGALSPVSLCSSLFQDGTSKIQSVVMKTFASGKFPARLYCASV
jgi:hypothetical protein